MQGFSYANVPAATPYGAPCYCKSCCINGFDQSVLCYNLADTTLNAQNKSPIVHQSSHA